MLRGAHDDLLQIRVGVARIFEEAELDLQSQDPADGVVDRLFAEPALCDGGLGRVEELGGVHN